MTTAKSSPRCPNHGCPLTDCHQGDGICPISGYRFAYDEDQAEKTRQLKVTAFGTLQETADWNVQSLDGDGG